MREPPGALVSHVEQPLLDLKQSPREEGIAQLHTESAREMIVTGTSQPPRGRCWLDVTDHGLAQGCDCFNCVRDLAACEPVEATATDPLDAQKLAVHQLRQMSARGWGRDVGDPRQLRSWSCLTSHQADEHAQADRLADQRGHLIQTRPNRHRSSVTVIVHPLWKHLAPTDHTV